MKAIALKSLLIISLLGLSFSLMSLRSPGGDVVSSIFWGTNTGWVLVAQILMAHPVVFKGSINSILCFG